VFDIKHSAIGGRTGQKQVSTTDLRGEKDGRRTREASFDLVLLVTETCHDLAWTVPGNGVQRLLHLDYGLLST
jgi:hypothetical protein